MVTTRPVVAELLLACTLPLGCAFGMHPSVAFADDGFSQSKISNGYGHGYDHGDVYISGDGLSLSVPVSPECWTTAMQVFDFFRGTPTSALCAQMTANDQKILALELARCHMNDVGRQLMRDPTVCASSSEASLRDCLAEFSDSGLNAYTHFYSYVNQLCIRLMQEVAAANMEETRIRLAASSMKAEERMQYMLNAMSLAAQEQDKKIQTMQQQQEEYDEKRNDMYERMLSDAQANAADVMAEMRRRQSEWMSEQEKWSMQLQELQKAHAAEMLKQKQDFEELSNALTNTNSFFRPWITGFYDIHGALSKSYSTLYRAVHAVATLLVVWIFTFPRRIRYLRVILCIMVFTQLIFEWVVNQMFLLALFCCYSFGVAKTMLWSYKEPNGDEKLLYHQPNQTGYQQPTGNQPSSFRQPVMSSGYPLLSMPLDEHYFGRASAFTPLYMPPDSGLTTNGANHNARNHMACRAARSQQMNNYSQGHGPVDSRNFVAQHFLPALQSVQSSITHANLDIHAPTHEPNEADTHSVTESILNVSIDSTLPRQDFRKEVVFSDHHHESDQAQNDAKVENATQSPGMKRKTTPGNSGSPAPPAKKIRNER